MKYILTALLLLSTAAGAQEAAPKKPEVQCLARETVTNQMVRSGASPILVAPMGNDLFEVWSDGTQWTAFVTRRAPAPVSCPIAGGVGEPRMADPICVDPVKCPRV